MRIAILPILLFVSAFCAMVSSAGEGAQYPKIIKFQNLVENKDIVLGEVRAVHQDRDGYIWLGGWNALVRYDGYAFRQVDIVVEGNGQPSTKPLTHAIDIIEDSAQKLWVSTSHGVAVYDKYRDQLNLIEDDPSQAQAITTTFMGQMVELPDGRILATSDVGVFLIQANGKGYQFIGGNNADPKALATPSHLRSISAVVTADQIVWVGTSAGLDRFDWQTNQFHYHKIDPQSAQATDNEVRVVIDDREGKLWLGTSNGIVHFDPNTGDSRRYTFDRDDPTSLGGTDIWGLLLDSENRLWVSVDQGGLNLLDAERQQFIRYTFDASVETSIPSNVVRTAYEDSSGDIWVTTYPEGVALFDQSTTAIQSFTHNPTNPNSLSHNSVLTVSEDKKGNLWLGTDGGGLNYFDRETGQFTHYRHDPGNANSLSSDAVLFSYLDQENVLWTGHWGGGITSFDIAAQTFTRHPFHFPEERIIESSKLNSGHVWSIYEDRKNTLWIATHTGGLSRYDRATQKFQHFWPNENDPTAIASEWIWTIFEDSSDNLWVGTTRGLDLLDRETGKFTHFTNDPQNPNSLSEPYVLSIYEDRMGQLWVGTNAGLNLWDKNTKTFTRFTKADGFNDDSIRTIVEDSEQRLWMGTANGVSSFDISTHEIKNYNRDGGKLVGGFNYGAAIRGQRGDIIMGGINGLRIYNPKGLTGNPNIPPVVFTDLKVFADSIAVGGDDGLLKQSINFTDTLVLDHTKSMFVLEFSALNYRDSKKNQYAYKLEGFDDQWFSAGDQRSAKYTNLDAGSYRFRVKASNNDGLWNETGREITIVQRPPPWQTWWAYSLYLIAALSLLFWLLMHQRSKRLRTEQQNRILEEKVSERTAELRRKNYDIQAMLSNMRQGLFTIEHDGRVHEEYSRYLETIFAKTDLAGQAFMPLLFGNAKLGSNAINQIQEATRAIIDEEAYNFEFNAHLLVTEYRLQVGDELKHLSLDWNPIVIDGVTKKLMISVRDVTKLREMEAEAHIQKRELDIISQLLNISRKKYASFDKSVRKYMTDNRQCIQRQSTCSDDAIALLFRNMHTIKGNCRTYGFTYLCDTAHEIESTYSQLKESSEATWDQNVMLAKLSTLEAALEEYATVYRRITGQDEGRASENNNGLWLDESALQTIGDSIAALQKHLGGGLDQTPVNPIQSLVDKAKSNRLEDVLSDIVNSLGSIADQLGKPRPKIVIEPSPMRIRDDGYGLVNDVFSHLMRNCIDHGIEPAEERIAQGKPPAGTITITADELNDQLNIRIRDDGRGLSIKRLFAIGVQQGRWEASSQPAVKDITETIFTSGVTTKETVTDISGRGVGMDAVKQYLREIGGDIAIAIIDVDESADFATFEMVVSIPKPLYTRA